MDPFAIDERQAATWDRIARFWDRHVGEDLPEAWAGVIDQLCVVDEGTSVLEIGCGNGRLARRLARRGARVVATDASAEFVRIAAQRSAGLDVSCIVVDATDVDAVRALGFGSFDVVVANMVVQNVGQLEPLMAGVRDVLAPGGRFVFSAHHPCFPGPIRAPAGGSGSSGGAGARAGALMGRVADRMPRALVSVATRLAKGLQAARGFDYMTTSAYRIAAPGQPVPHVNIHRPLQALLAPAFEAGLVLDGFREVLSGADGSSPVGKTPTGLMVRLRRMS